MTERVSARQRSDFLHRWHVGINRHFARDNEQRGSYETDRVMYDAKQAAGELPRLALLFKREREGKLAPTLQRCSLSPVEPVPENHLTCCLAVKCRECPMLMALDRTELTDEQRDEAKAWTCVAHIIASGGDRENEGYILTVDDRMYWDGVYSSLTAGGTDEPEDSHV